MNTGAAAAQELIRQVVRGEKPWTDLHGIGIQVQLHGPRCTIDNPGKVRASADVLDLASGLLAHQHDVGELRTWAFLMEAEGFVDWEAAEQDPQWEDLWDGLWAVSFGNPIPEQALKAAHEIVQRKHSIA